MKKSFLIFFITGSIFVLIFGIFKTVQGDALPKSAVSIPFYLQTTKSISDTTAYQLFMEYHKSNTPDRSQGVLLNKEQPISYFYLDNETMIEPLKNKAQSLGKEFLGLSAIPAFDQKNNTHTMIWVAVVNEGSGRDITPVLMLPDKNEKWESYIYDHTMTCPEMCAENALQLWNENWKAE